MNSKPQHYEILKDSYREMQSQMEEQFLHSAIEKVELFLKYHPGHATAHNDLAVLYYRKGETLQTLGHYQKATRLAPDNAVFQKNLANFYFKEMGWAEEAAELYQEILRLAPDDVEGLIALATISSVSGNFDQARAWFEKVLALQTGGGKEAPGTVDDSTCHDPAHLTPAVKTPTELYRQACGYAASGRDSEAVASLEEMLRGNPGHALAHNDLGVLYLRTGNRAGALEEHRQAVSLDPANATFAQNLAGLYLDEGRTDEAVFILVDQVNRHPEDIDTLTALGNVSLTLDRTGEARNFFEKVLALEPWNQTAREAVAALDPAPAPPMPPQLSQPADETASLDELLARLRSTISPAADTETLYQKAQTLAEAGSFDAAISQLEALLVQDPKFAAAHNDLGVLYYRMDERTRSIGHHIRAVELAPENLTYQKNLAGLYLTDGATRDDAIFLLTGIIRKHPRDIETLFTLGKVCLEMDCPEEAKLFLRTLLEQEPWNREARELLELSCKAAA
jgi:Flp pilus assembly protein TadD